MSYSNLFRSLFRGRPVYAAPAQPIRAIPATLPVGTVGEVYPAFQFRHSGGSGGAVRWEITGDTRGVPVTEAGVLGGAAPSAAGPAAFTGVVVDVATGTRSAPVNYTFRVDEALAMVPKAAPDGLTGAAWSYTYEAVGGLAPRTFVEATVRPAGATWNGATGTLSFASAPTGAVTHAAFARDSAGRQTQPTSIAATIFPDLAITTASIPPINEGATPSVTMAAAGAVGTLTWSASGTAATAGLGINSATGALTGSIATGGSYALTVDVVDGTSGDTARRTFTVTVMATASAPVIVTSSVAHGTTGEDYVAAIEVTPGSSGSAYLTVVPYPGTTGLPAGVGVAPLLSQIRGNTDLEGEFTARIRAVDEADPTIYSERTFTIRFYRVPVITDPGTLSATAGVAYSHQLAGSGYGALTWGRESGSYAGGGSISTGGLVTGTSNIVQATAAVTTLTDPDGRVGRRTIYMDVDSALTLTAPELPDATAGSAYAPGVGFAASGGEAPYSYAEVGSHWGVIDGSTGEVTGSPGSGDEGLGVITCEVTDADGRKLQASALVRVVASASAPVVDPISDITTVVDTPIEVFFDATGGTEPYSTWETQSALPTGLSIETLADGRGRMYGSRSSVLTTTSIAVRCTDDAANVSAYRSFTLTVVAAAGTGDRAFLHALPGIVQERYFDSSDDVHRYAFRNTLYTGDPAIGTDRDPARLQWVDASHPDAALIPPGLNGIMKISYPTTAGDNAINVVFRLKEAWSQAANPWIEGYGSGDEYWFAFDFLVTEAWVNGDSGRGGGPKIFILNRLNAHNTNNEGQEYCNNFGYRGILQGGADGGNNAFVGHNGRWETTMNISGSNRIVFQPAVDHQANPGRHPSGATPPTPGTAAYDIWRYGGIYGTDYVAIDGGAVQFTRDMVGKWARFIGHRKYGNPMWENNNSVKEDWICLPGQDALPMFRTNQRRYDLATETLSGFNSTAYGRSFAVAGADCPEGGHPINMIWLLFQDTGRTGTATPEPPREIYFSRFIVREGPVGIPAPGFTTPPRSYYDAGSGGGTPSAGGYIVIGSGDVTNGNHRMLDAVSQSWATTNLSAFSGWAIDHLRGIIRVFGGGHVDCVANPFLTFDTNPDINGDLPGWVENDTSIPSAARTLNASNQYTYTDGRPGARHTYCGHQVMNDGRSAIAGGSRYSDGYMTSELLIADWAAIDRGESVANCYSHYPFPSGLTDGSTGVYAISLHYDWQRNLLILWNTQQGRYTVFDPATETYSAVRTVTAFTSSTAVSELSYTGGIWRLLGMRGGTSQVMEWNGSTLTAGTVVTHAGAGAEVGTLGNIALTWDRNEQAYFGIRTASDADGVYLYKGTWTASATLTWTRTAVNLGTTQVRSVNGGWRHLFPTADALWLVTDENQPVVKVDKP